MTQQLAQRGAPGALAHNPKALVLQRMDAILDALPNKRESALKRFRQAAVGVLNVPSISKCTPETVYSAIYTCARLNLVPDPVLKQVYIIPFKGRATVVLGYNGLIDLARRAVPGLELSTGVVYDNDSFVLTEGLNPRFDIIQRHWQKGQTPGEIVFAYCVWRLPEQQKPTLTIVPRHKLDALAQAAKAKSYGDRDTPWQTDFDAMAEKTAVRRASKLWTLSPEQNEHAARFREAVDIDENDEQPQVEIETGALDGLAQLPAGEHRIGSVQPARKVEPSQPTRLFPHPTQDMLETEADGSDNGAGPEPDDAAPDDLATPGEQLAAAAAAEAALDAAAVKVDHDAPLSPAASRAAAFLQAGKQAQAESKARATAPAPLSGSESARLRGAWSRLWGSIDARITASLGSLPRERELQPMRDRLLELVSPGGPPVWDTAPAAQVIQWIGASSKITREQVIAVATRMSEEEPV